MQALTAQDLTLGYGNQIIIDNLNLTVPKGEITVLIGANGCGKSTLLQSMARLLKPKTGSVILDGHDIAKLKTKETAKKLSILPQTPIVPEGLTVLELVKQGRNPHRSFLKHWSKQDSDVVNHALHLTNMLELKDRSVDSLSGGQRQRAWIAMNLAQQTDTLLLDEPTTYLDLSHQIDVLDLLFELNEKDQKTIVMVLHDLNLACRYAHHIVAIKDKKVFSQGKPEEIINCELVRDVFQLECDVFFDPRHGTPMCIPHGKGRFIDNY